LVPKESLLFHLKLNPKKRKSLSLYSKNQNMMMSLNMCSNKILIPKKLVINLGKQQTSIPNLKFQSRMSNLKSNQVKMSSFVLSLTNIWKSKSLSTNSLCNSQPVKHSLPKHKMIKINLKKMEAHLVTISWLKLQSNKQNLLNSLKKPSHKKFTLKE
jgi:hypothetical protein